LTTASTADAEGLPLAEFWRIADKLDLMWQDWDEDEVVVFSQRLGRSLLLNAASARVLAFLATVAPSAISLTVLTEQLLPCCAPGTTKAEAMALLDAALPEFYRIGLVEPMVNRN
jgi:hypothetical protein